MTAKRKRVELKPLTCAEIETLIFCGKPMVARAASELLAAKSELQRVNLRLERLTATIQDALIQNGCPLSRLES